MGVVARTERRVGISTSTEPNEREAEEEGVGDRHTLLRSSDASRLDSPHVARSATFLCLVAGAALLLLAGAAAMPSLLLPSTRATAALHAASAPLDKAHPSTTRVWLLDPQQPRYSVDLSYPKAELPAQFWNERGGEQKADSTPDSVPLSLTVHAGRFDSAEGHFHLIASLELRPNEHTDVRRRGYQYNTREWRFNNTAAHTLRRRLRCQVVAEDEFDRPLGDVIFRLYSIELRCPWYHAPAAPPDSLRLRLSVLLAENSTLPPLAVLDLPMTSAVERTTDYALCTQVRGDESPHHKFDWVTYHVALGFQLLVVSDRTGSMRDVLRPYIDAGVVLYRHASVLPSDVEYAYDQTLEMEYCRLRLMDRVGWIAHWDTDEWLALPAAPAWQRDASQVRSTALTGSRLEAYQAAVRASNVSRDYLRFPVVYAEQPPPSPHNTSALHHFMRQRALAPLTWATALSSEAVLFQRFDASVYDAAQLQYVSIQARQPESDAAAQAANALRVYVPMAELYPGLTGTTALTMKKWMGRARMLGDYFVHNPVYGREVQATRLTPPPEEPTQAHLLHYSNFYSPRSAFSATAHTAVNSVAQLWRALRQHAE